MSTPADAQRRLEAANPVVSASAKPTTAWSSAALLEHIDRRSGDMQTKETPTRVEYEPATKKTQRPRWLIPALAGATAVIAAIVVASVLLIGGDESKSLYAEAAAGGDPQAVAGLFADSFRIGDVDTIVDYLHPDFSTRRPTNDQVAFVSSWVEFEGALYGREEAGPSVCESADNGWVFCTYVDPPGSVLASVGRAETTWAAQILDGQIRRMDLPGDLVELVTTVNYIMEDFETPLGSFARAEDPDGSGTACDVVGSLPNTVVLNAGLGTVYDKTCGAFLAGFVDDYAASLGS